MALGYKGSLYTRWLKALKCAYVIDVSRYARDLVGSMGTVSGSVLFSVTVDPNEDLFA